MSFTEHIKNHKAIPHIATDIVNTPAGNIVATNVQTAINELDTEKVPYIGGTGNIDIGDFELRAQTLEADVATGTAPLTIASTTVNTNLNADLLDNLHGTGYTKTTAGQTINVSTAAELTSALAALAAAPSLLGNVIIQLAAGTYADAITIPSLIGNVYSLTLQGGTTTNLTDTATGGSAGTNKIQAYISQAGAAYTVNAYRGQWLKFTSGVLINQVFVVDDNTATQINLCGAFLSSVPQNGDTFIIYSNSASITGKITVIPTTTSLYLQNINIADLTVLGLLYGKFTEIKQTTSQGYITNKIASSTIDYDKSSFNIPNTSYYGIWNFGSLLQFSECFAWGNSTANVSWFVITQGGGMTYYRCGTVIDTFWRGSWTSGGGTDNYNHEDITGLKSQTYNHVKNCTTGIFANYNASVNGNHVMDGNNGIELNTTFKTPAAATDAAYISATS